MSNQVQGPDDRQGITVVTQGTGDVIADVVFVDFVVPHMLRGPRTMSSGLEISLRRT